MVPDILHPCGAPFLFSRSKNSIWHQWLRYFYTHYLEFNLNSDKSFRAISKILVKTTTSKEIGDTVLKSTLETCWEKEWTVWFLAKWEVLTQCSDSWAPKLLAPWWGREAQISYLILPALFHWTPRSLEGCFVIWGQYLYQSHLLLRSSNNSLLLYFHPQSLMRCKLPQSWFTDISEGKSSLFPSQKRNMEKGSPEVCMGRYILTCTF